MYRGGLKALAMLAAALPLAGFGGQAAGLAPGQKTIDANQAILAAAHIDSILFGKPPPGKGGDDEEEEEVEEAEGGSIPKAAPSAISVQRQTRGLERALGALGEAGLDADALRALEENFQDEVDDIEANLDDIEADLDDDDAELDEIENRRGVEGSPQLRQAEEKLRELEDELRSLRQRLANVRRQVLDGASAGSVFPEIRSLGRDIATLKEAERVELAALIEEAEKRERPGGPPDDRGGGGDEEPSPEPSPSPEP